MLPSARASSVLGLRVSPFVRQVAKAVAVAGTTLSLSLATAGALYHRPQPDIASGTWGGPNHRSHEAVTEEHRRRSVWFSSESPSSSSPVSKHDNNGEPTATALSHLAESPVRRSRLTRMDATMSELSSTLLLLGHKMSQRLALFACNVVIYLGMNHYNHHEVLRDDRYDAFIRCVRRTNSNNNVGGDVAPTTASTTTALLTVSNHASTIDDPVLFGLLLPNDIKFRPDKLRWGLCSQEICFKHPVVASILGAGKVLPIRRGGGIDQSLLRSLSAKLWSGSWVHVFPEGKVVQSGCLGADYFGTRSDDAASEVGGRLKWGVGKMVAHACQTELHVVPIHHVGMEGVVPQKVTGKTLHKYPLGSNFVKVRVGRRVLFEDLIREHESKHGSLIKYPSGTFPSGGSGGRWNSTQSKRELYSRIAKRIEDALLELEEESRSDPNHEVQMAYKKFVQS